MAKIKIFPLYIECSCTTLWVKNSLEIALSLTVFEILTLFHFPLKSKMATKVTKIEILPLLTGYSCTTMRVKNSLEIALSLTVSEIFSMFYFPAEIQDGHQKWRKLKFFPSTYDTLVLPAGSKNLLEIAQSLTVFEILMTFSHFH